MTLSPATAWLLISGSSSSSRPTLLGMSPPPSSLPIIIVIITPFFPISKSSSSPPRFLSGRSQSLHSLLSLSLSLSPPPLYLSLCFGWTSIPLFSQNRHCAFFRPGNASISRVLVWRIMVLIFYLLFVFNPRELSLLKCWPRIAWQRTNFCDAAIQRGLIPVNSNQAGFRYSVV